MIHFMLMFAMLLTYIFQLFWPALPIQYYTILIVNVTCIIQFFALSQNLRSIDNFDPKRMCRIRIIWFMALLMFLIGLNPIKGYGSLCDNKMLYPLGFMFMIAFQLIVIILILYALKKKGSMSIKGKDVEDYYNHI
jgi:hypothetical protein